MLIPSIDIMGGKVVQLVQGEKKMLEFDSPEEWIERFQHFPLVQLIDLDAALGRGTNTSIVEAICTRLPAQEAGGRLVRRQTMRSARSRGAAFLLPDDEKLTVPKLPDAANRLILRF